MKFLDTPSASISGGETRRDNKELRLCSIQTKWRLGGADSKYQLLDFQRLLSTLALRDFPICLQMGPRLFSLAAKPAQIGKPKSCRNPSTVGRAAHCVLHWQRDSRRWSPGGRWIAFMQRGRKGVELALVAKRGPQRHPPMRWRSLQKAPTTSHDPSVPGQPFSAQ